MFHINAAGHMCVISPQGALQAAPTQSAGSTQAAGQFIGASNVPAALRAVPAAQWVVGPSAADEAPQSFAPPARQSSLPSRYALPSNGPGDMPLDLRTRSRIQDDAAALAAPSQLQLDAAIGGVEDIRQLPPYFAKLRPPQQTALKYWVGPRDLPIGKYCARDGQEYDVVRHYVDKHGELSEKGHELLKPNPLRDAKRRHPITGVTYNAMVAYEWYAKTASGQAKFGSHSTFCSIRNATSKTICRLVNAYGVPTEAGRKEFETLERNLKENGYLRADGGLTEQGMNLFQAMDAGAIR